MDVGGATHWSMPRVVSRARDAAARSRRTTAPITPVVEAVIGAGRSLPLPDGTVFGIISSTTEPFCDSCDRSRLTADGLWYLCLYATHGTDLRRPLRAGASAEQLAQLIRATWEVRSDRGAEERLAQPRSLAADPGRSPEARPAPRDAHARRLTTEDFTCPTNRGDAETRRSRHGLQCSHRARPPRCSAFLSSVTRSQRVGLE